MSKGYSCRIERHSKTPDGRQAVTWVIRFPRRVLAEVITHRTVSQQWGDEVSVHERATTEDMSKNSASSRAIPLERMLHSVLEDPFVPHWTRNQKGMQGEGVSDPAVLMVADGLWKSALHGTVEFAKALHGLGIHKQDCNRLLEPWAWVTQVVTGSFPSMNNFFALRTHHAADPHFRLIARMMYLSYLDSTPQAIDYGGWHLPFTEKGPVFSWPPPTDQIGLAQIPLEIKRSVARCAWVSYNNHDRDATDDAILKTCERLVAEIPLHACYDAETEVLTADGWKRFADAGMSDYYMTLDPTTDRMQYQLPSAVHRYPFKGDLISIKTDHCEAMVTDNHRMFAARRKGVRKEPDTWRDWRLVPASEFADAAHKIRMGQGIWEAPEKCDKLASLVGFFIGDGSYCKSSYAVGFSLRKQRKISYLKSLCHDLGFEVTNHSSDRFYVACPPEFKQIAAACYEAGQKRVPEDWMFAGLRTLTALLEGLIESDGHRGQNGRIRFSTTSAKLRDQVQEIALKTGGAATWRLNEEAGINYWGGRSRDCYSVCLYQTRSLRPKVGWTAADRVRQVTRQPYDGTVYCVTIPNSILYVRRNGKPMWCGNSPLEHQLTPLHPRAEQACPRYVGNIRGWLQARKLLTSENLLSFRPSEQDVQDWREECSSWYRKEAVQ